MSAPPAEKSVNKTAGCSMMLCVAYWFAGRQGGLMAEPTRTVECWGCQETVTLVLESRWTPDRKDACPACGTVIADHAKAAELAADRMTHEEAVAIMQRHSWDDVMAYARIIATDDPATLTPEQVDAVYAFCRLRSTQQQHN